MYLKLIFKGTCTAEAETQFLLTFFIWNLMVPLTSSTFTNMLSVCVRREGNFPALLSPGPRIRGICLMRLSEARKASYFLAVWCGENGGDKINL